MVRLVGVEGEHHPLVEEEGEHLRVEEEEEGELPFSDMGAVSLRTSLFL